MNDETVAMIIVLPTIVVVMAWAFKTVLNFFHNRRTRPQTNDIPELDPARGHAEEVDMRNDVGGAMAEIGPRDRQMLWLAYVEGASHREIAEIMGIRPASVRSMLFRARGRLADELSSRGLRPGLEAS